jgi:hypothetical protein
MSNQVEKTVNKSMDFVKDALVTVIPVIMGLVVYKLLLEKPITKVANKMWGENK